jgi:hypothetical protein
LLPGIVGDERAAPSQRFLEAAATSLGRGEILVIPGNPSAAGVAERDHAAQQQRQHDRHGSQQERA